MSDLIVPSGDKGYDLNFVVKDPDDNNAVFDLDGYTVTLKVWKAGRSDTLLLEGGCDIDVAANGTCHYTIIEDNFVDLKKDRIELELTTAAGVILSTENYELKVEESG